jgi:hypothetical protein
MYQFPCLMLTTTERHNNARKWVKRLRRKLIPGGELLDFPVHLERTLDEAYYPGLGKEVLEKRNHDQVVSHSSENFANLRMVSYAGWGAPILIVPQLWLWRVGRTLVSVFDSMASNLVSNHARAMSLVEEAEGDSEVLEGLVITEYKDHFG